ncbi:MAG: putative glycoside hydrolase [Colwellia sp.]
MTQMKKIIKRATQFFTLSLFVLLSSVLTNVQASDFALSIKTEDDKGNHYNNVSRKRVTHGDWVQISGKYTHKVDGKEVSKPYLYIEGPDAGIDFYLDAVSVIDLSQDKNDNILATDNANFESGTITPWFKNGSAKLTLEKEQVKEGQFSLKITKRTENWQGAALTFNNGLVEGNTYLMSVWVKLVNAEQSAKPKTVKKKNSVNTDYVYFRDGKALGSWAVTLGDETNWNLRLKGNTGESSNKQLKSSPATYKVANDALNLKWSRKKGKGQFALYGQPIDLSNVENIAALTMQVKVIKRPKKGVLLGMDCGYPCRGEMNIHKMFRELPKGEWVTFPIPINCFSAQGLDTSKINGPLLISTDGKFEIEIADVRIELLPEGTPTCAP